MAPTLTQAVEAMMNGRPELWPYWVTSGHGGIGLGISDRRIDETQAVLCLPCLSGGSKEDIDALRDTRDALNRDYWEAQCSDST